MADGQYIEFKSINQSINQAINIRLLWHNKMQANFEHAVKFCTAAHNNKYDEKLSYRRETARRAMSLDHLSNAVRQITS